MSESNEGEREPVGSPIGVALVTVATYRPDDPGAGADEIVSMLEGEDLEVAVQEHIDVDHDTIQSIVARLTDRDDVDLIVTSGGTSVEPGDVTLEAVDPLIDKELTAFSELFTTIAHGEFGTTVLAARTRAFVSREVPVFCLPGNRDAVRLALEELILPEARHLVVLAREDATEGSPEDDGSGGTDDGE